MYLGIEIGGTKLQLGLGTGSDPEFVDFLRYDVDASRGAAGIREQIVEGVRRIRERHEVTRIGFGFGGPVDSSAQVVTKSHQIDGWDGFPIGQWCSETFGLPIALANDCDSAALAEARFGAGRSKRTVFYVTVGTGIGGGFVIDGKVQGAGRPAASEIGHMRPGLLATNRGHTVESLASGRGIEALAQATLAGTSRDLDGLLPRPHQQSIQSVAEDRAAFETACSGDLSAINTQVVAELAHQRNATAMAVIDTATNVLGWAIAQVITLLSPEVVVVGGGVSLMGEDLFFKPLRDHVACYVFGPSSESYVIVPAALGEEVVVHGAVALAAASENL